MQLARIQPLAVRLHMPGGGHCLAPSRVLQDNTPLDNALAMYEAAEACGEY